MTEIKPIEITHQEMRKKLIDDLFDVVNGSRVDVGHGLNQIDIVGSLEWVKLWYVHECFQEDS